MIKISRYLEYALISIKSIEDKNRQLSAKEISQNFGIPFDILSKTLQKLSRSGLLKTQHGPKGGYKLSKDLNRISLHDLNRALGYDNSLIKCHSLHKCNLEKSCNIKKHLFGLELYLKNFMQSVSLKSIFEVSYKENNLPNIMA